MKEFTYIITDKEGIHARPAGELVKLAKEYTSTVSVLKDGKKADAKKVFGLMGLGVKQGGYLWHKNFRERSFWGKPYIMELQWER